MSYTLINDDCRKVFANLKDKSTVIITDPPYNASKSNIKVDKMYYKTIGSKEENNEWDKDFNPLDFLPEMDRVSKTMIIFCSHHLLNTYLTWKEPTMLLHWYKTNPMPSFRGRPSYSIEYILWYGKDYYNKGSKHNVYQYPTVGGYERTDHPSQKPLKLMEELISDFSTKEDTILDPFMGSGTTIVGCMNLGRDSIGIENKEENFIIAKDRIEKTNPVLFL